MAFTDQELDEFEKEQLKDAWENVFSQQPYPRSMKPSLIYNKLYSRDPMSPVYRAKLKALDQRLASKKRPYDVSIAFKGTVYKYRIGAASNASTARHSAILRYIDDNSNGHTSEKLVNSLSALGELVITVTQPH